MNNIERNIIRVGTGLAILGVTLTGCDRVKFVDPAQATPTTAAGTPTPKGEDRIKVATATPKATVLASRDCLDAPAILGAEELKRVAALVTAEITGKPLPFENGKYQTFPRQVDRNGCISGFQEIDLGTLGPDVDTIFGIDFEGDIPTGALVVYQPSGKVSETRVVGIKRADLETVQLRPAIGGDRFDLYQMSQYGGDVALDRMARLHTQNTARTHQKVVYIGDLGAFETQWGKNEREFLNRIIRAQRPERLDIIAPNFVNPRTFR